MTKWSTAISNTRLQDRNLREMSEKPLQDIMKSARKGNLDSLNYLLQQTSLDKIQTRSISVCEQLFHLGKERECEGLYCDGALSSCVEVAVKTIYGTSSDLSKAPKRAIAIQLRFDEAHAKAIGLRFDDALENDDASENDDAVENDDAPEHDDAVENDDAEEKGTGKSVLEYWDEKLEPGDNHLSVWVAHMISAMNREGWVTDCRRKWNQTRSIAQRMDQANYFYRSNKLTGLGQAFVQEWNKKTIDSEVFEIFGVSKFDVDNPTKVKHEINLLTTWLGAIYDDACESWIEVETYNCRRILENLVLKNMLTPEHSKSSNALKLIETTCSTIEKNLKDAYAVEGTVPTICEHLDAARTMTRVISEMKETATLELLEARSHLDGTGKR